MADIKRFTGFIAPDGTTHSSLTAATNYTRELKIKEALAEFASIKSEDTPEFQTGIDAAGDQIIRVEDLPLFLRVYKDKILAAFNQDVQMRAPRKAKLPKVVENIPFDAAA